MPTPKELQLMDKYFMQWVSMYPTKIKDLLVNNLTAAQLDTLYSIMKADMVPVLQTKKNHVDSKESSLETESTEIGQDITDF